MRANIEESGWHSTIEEGGERVWKKIYHCRVKNEPGIVIAKVISFSNEEFNMMWADTEPE